MGLLIGISVFLIAVWLTVSLCARKGWPLWVGLALGILLQPVGRTATMFIGFCLVGIAPVLGVLFVLAAPFLGAAVPIVLAMSLPYTAKAESEQQLGQTRTAKCPQCGRENAVTSRICPRCGQRAGEA